MTNIARRLGKLEDRIAPRRQRHAAVDPSTLTPVQARAVDLMFGYVSANGAVDWSRAPRDLLRAIASIRIPDD